MRAPLIKTVALILAIGLHPNLGRAQDSTSAHTGYAAYMEEDFFFPPKNRDQNYTMGIGIHIAGPLVHRIHADALLNAADWLSRVKLVHSSPRMVQHTLSFTLSGTAFTPDSLASRNPVVGDRPYAFLLGFTATRVSTPQRNDREAITSEFTFGLLGLGIGRGVQQGLHHAIRWIFDDHSFVVPQGWRHQIANGGEPTARYMVGWEHLLAPLTSVVRDGFGVQTSAGVAGNVGYYTELDGAINVRFGRLSTPFWQFRSNPMSAANRGAPGERSKRPSELFLFGALRPRGVLYNELLTGGIFRHNDYTLAQSQVEHAILEGDLGLSYSHSRDRGRPPISVTIVFPSFRTREFISRYQRAHYWGSVFIGW